MYLSKALLSKSVMFGLSFILSNLVFTNCSHAQYGWKWGVGSRNCGMDPWGRSVVDSAGNVYICAAYQGGVSGIIGSLVISDAGDASQLLVTKVDSSGNFLWKVSTDNAPGQTWPVGMTSDPFGNLYVLGVYYNDTNFSIGSFNLHAPVSPICFLTKISSSGSVIWAKIVAQSSKWDFGTYEFLGGIGSDGAGNVYVSDVFTLPSVTIGSTTLANNGHTSIFLAKYDPAGNSIWAKSYGDGRTTYTYTLAVSRVGNIFINGEHNSDSNLVIGSYTLTGATDFLAMIDSSGTPVWAQNINPDMHIDAMTTDVPGNLFVTGSINQSFVLGGTTLAYSGISSYPNGVVAEYNTAGTVLWANSAISTLPVEGHAITVDNCGNIWVTGEMGYNVPVNFNGHLIYPPSLDEDPMFIAEYNGLGHFISGLSLPSGGDDAANIGFDNFNNFYIVGDNRGVPMIFGADTLPASISIDEMLFVAKYRYDSLSDAEAIAGTSDLCTGSTAIFTDLAGGGSWSVSNGHATINSLGLVTAVSPGIDTITYSLTNICYTSTATHTLNVYPLPTSGSITGSAYGCVGASTFLTGTVSGGTWGSSNTSVATVSPAGAVTGISAGTTVISYSVSNVCGTAIKRDTLPIVAPPVAAPVSSFPSGPYCVGDTLRVADATVGGTWHSSNIAVAIVGTTGLVGCISAGTTIMSYAVSNICGSDIAKKTILVNPLPFAGFVISTHSGSLCPYDTFSVSDVVPGGIWSSGTAAVATIGSLGFVTGLTSGTAVISYSVSNICGVAVAKDTLTVNPMANAGIITSNHANAFCIGDTFTVADTVPGGVWRVADTNLVTLKGTFATVIHAGYDTVFYTAGNACDTVSTSYPIFIDSLPPITGKLTVCPDDTTVLGDARGGGFWSGSFPVDVSTSVADSGIVAGLVTGVAVVTYHVDLGCSVFATITVLGAPVPGSIGGHSPLCEGATATLSETKGGGTWTSSNTSVAVIGSSGIVNTLSLGSATITYTVGPDTNGCTNISRFYLTVISSPLYISSLVLPPTCYGGSDGSIIATTSGSNGPFVWAWTNGDSAYMANFLSVGSYKVLTMDKLTLCTAVDSFTMTQPDSLIVSAEVTNDNCHERRGSITVTAAGGTPPYYYYWPNSTGASVSGLSAGMYTALIKDNNSCTKYLRATVEDTCNSIVIHNVITPNGDGVNDVWEIEGLADYPKNTVQVFDKWGTQLYEKSNYSNDWGGRGSNGELLPDGTYYYLVKLNGENTTGGPGVFKGAILIKR